MASTWPGSTGRPSKWMMPAMPLMARERPSRHQIGERGELAPTSALVVHRHATALDPGMGGEHSLLQAHADAQVALDTAPTQQPAEQQRAREAGGGKRAWRAAMLTRSPSAWMSGRLMGPSRVTVSVAGAPETRPGPARAAPSENNGIHAAHAATCVARQGRAPGTGPCDLLGIK